MRCVLFLRQCFTVKSCCDEESARRGNEHFRYTLCYNASATKSKLRHKFGICIMQWSDIISDPHLRNIPYKIELNEYGQIVMTPHSFEHSALQEVIADELKRWRPEGRTPPEFAIHTPKGTKSADVVWCSKKRFAKIRSLGGTEAMIAPEICIEVLPPSNSQAEMTIKKQLYFEMGAEEVWICDEKGCMTFYTLEGEQDASLMFTAFPKKLEY